MHKLSFLTKKIGPLPAIAWVAILVGGLFVARYLRSQNAAKSDVTPSDTSASTYDPGSTVSGSDIGLTGALPNQDTVAGGFVDTTNEAQTGLIYDALGQFASTLTDLEGVVQNLSDEVGAHTASPVAPVPVGGDGAPPANNPPPVRQPAAVNKAGVVVKQVKLKNGATLTTFADGRVEEQVPGKKPYVVKKAPKQPTRLLTSAWLGISDAPIGYGVSPAFESGSAPASQSLSLLAFGAPAHEVIGATDPNTYDPGSPDAVAAAATGPVIVAPSTPGGLFTTVGGTPILEHAPGLTVISRNDIGMNDAYFALNPVEPAVRSTAYSPSVAPAASSGDSAAGHSIAIAPAPVDVTPRPTIGKAVAV